MGNSIVSTLHACVLGGGGGGGEDINVDKAVLWKSNVKTSHFSNKVLSFFSRH